MTAHASGPPWRDNDVIVEHGQVLALGHGQALVDGRTKAFVLCIEHDAPVLWVLGSPSLKLCGGDVMRGVVDHHNFGAASL